MTPAKGPDTVSNRAVSQIEPRLAEGVRLFDDHGRAYLDFLSGIGVTSLGLGIGLTASAFLIADRTSSSDVQCRI